MRILEFGSGEGHQLAVLAQLGRVVASDITRSPHLSPGLAGSSFVVCDIAHAPFRADTFDLIYSNHVLEHVEELDLGLEEVQRIGKPTCVFAFTLPTPLWLFLSLPAQYLDRVKRTTTALRRIMSRGSAARPASISSEGRRVGRATRLRMIILPQGHGRYPGFLQACSVFRKSSWLHRFSRHGLSAADCHGLLLYASGRWPVVPVSRTPARLGLASSRLFVLRGQRGDACRCRRDRSST
jgi:SAM-dependent methyltransferase